MSESAHAHLEGKKAGEEDAQRCCCSPCWRKELMMKQKKKVTGIAIESGDRDDRRDRNIGDSLSNNWKMLWLYFPNDRSNTW